MATAMMAPIAPQSEPQVDDAPKIEHPLRGPSRLLQRHRMAFDAEIEHATELMARHGIDSEEDIYNQETLDRAITFLKRHIRHVWESCGTTASIPAIGPGPDRSIDLYWKQSSWKLLVNIPADGDAEATFYGDDYGRNRTEGSLDPNDLSRTVVSWLIT